MALGKRESLLRRPSRRDQPGADLPDMRELRRAEERQKTLTEATERWLSLLREMQHAGQTGDARYETYFRAYLEAKQRQKRFDLEIFNMRQGLSN
jgi:hypothetical protein